MAKNKSNKKLKIALILAFIIVSFSIYCYLSSQNIVPSVSLTTFQQCSPIVIEGYCDDVSDCLELLPNDMPGDIRDVGNLECIDNECIFTPYSCVDGIYEPS